MLYTTCTPPSGAKISIQNGKLNVPNNPIIPFMEGDGIGVDITPVMKAVVDAAGTGRVEHVPWPPDRDSIDIGSYFGDSSKAKRMLGWSPAVTFAEGIGQTVAFYREHLERYL